MIFEDYLDPVDWDEHDRLVDYQEQWYWSQYTQQEHEQFWKQYQQANNTGELPDEYYLTTTDHEHTSETR